MASVDELSAAVAATKDAIEQNTAVVAAAMQQAEELSGQLAAMGVESKSSQAMQVKDSLEQIQAQLAGLQSAAEQIQQQAEALRGLQGDTGGGVSVGDSVGGNQIPTPAGLLAAGGNGGDPPPPGPPTTQAAANEPPEEPPLRPRSAAGFGRRNDDDIDFSVRVLSDKEANEVATGLGTVPEDFDPYEERLTSRPVRAVRVAARGLEDVEGGAKQVTSDIFNFKKFFDPPANNSYTEVQPKDTGPQLTAIPSANAGVDPIQAAANAAVLTVAAAKLAVGRRRRGNE